MTVGKETRVFQEKSKHFNEENKNGEEADSGDIVRFVIRGVETMKLANVDEFLSYPFESLTFTVKVELSDFEIDG